MEFHELSTLFPSFEGTMEFEALALSIKTDGFDPKYPILTWKGKIIDGRHRYLAAQQANVEPTYRNLSDEASLDTALVEVTKANMLRRSLTLVESTIVAEKMANLTSGVGKGQNTKNANLRTSSVSIDDAANKMNVSPRSVDSVRNLKNNHPETYEQLEKGEFKSINAAVKSVQQRIDDGEFVPIPSTLPPHGYFISKKYDPTASAACIVTGAASLYCHGNDTTESLKEYVMGNILNTGKEGAMKDYEVNSLLHFKNVLNEISTELTEYLNSKKTKH